MKIKVLCPSYKRPGMVEVLGAYPWAILAVSPEEEEAYSRENPGAELYVMSEGVQGNLPRVRNHLLDTFLPLNDCVIMIDDDIRRFQVIEGQTVRKMDPDHVDQMIYHGARLAADLGVKLWGINLAWDRMGYKDFTPFSMSTFVGGPFHAIMQGCRLRYDLAMQLKDDYDYVLQHLSQNRKVLRLNKYHYVNRIAEQVGGTAMLRSVAREKEAMERLQTKWGTRIVTTSDRSHIAKKRKAEKTIQINPILRVPIKGP